VLRLYGPLADEGAGSTVPLLLPDAPIVTWWPHDAPENPAKDPIGALSHRRITDAAAEVNPIETLQRRAANYAEGDTDLAWTRLTSWRAMLTAAMDLPPYEKVTAATVTGEDDSPSTDLLAAWLAVYLDVPVRRVEHPRGPGIVSAVLERPSGNVEIHRPDGKVGTLTQPDQPDRRIALHRREVKDCLAEELRRLDPDEIYEETIRKGLPRLGTKTVTASAAIREGEAPSVKEAEKQSRRVARANAKAGSAQMVTAPPPSDSSDETTVKKAAARKLAGTDRASRKGGRAAAAAPSPDTDARANS
jgi:glucose-6-phosphate dehydrogenase assembly protein OpcA